MIQSNESEQRKVMKILLECFLRNETFACALAKIKEQTPISPKLERDLEAKWNIWELYGEPND